jgi:hypothetical protein
VRKEDLGFEGEEKETSCTLVGCKYWCQGGLVDDDASWLRIFGGVTSFGYE